MRLFTLLLLFAFLNSSAQTKYLAVYESKINLDYSKTSLPKKQLQFTTDSSNQTQPDSLLKMVDTTIIREVLQKMLGGAVTIYSRVEADAESATLAAYNATGQINFKIDSLFYGGSKWSYGPQKNYKELDIRPEKFEYTGNKKEILGYVCYEAITNEIPNGTIVWVCKELPQSISPGITTQNLNCAVFEYTNQKANLNFVIKSFKKF